MKAQRNTSHFSSANTGSKTRESTPAKDFVVRKQIKLDVPFDHSKKEWISLKLKQFQQNKISKGNTDIDQELIKLSQVEPTSELKFPKIRGVTLKKASVDLASFRTVETRRHEKSVEKRVSNFSSLTTNAYEVNKRSILVPTLASDDSNIICSATPVRYRKQKKFKTTKNTLKVLQPRNVTEKVKSRRSTKFSLISSVMDPIIATNRRIDRIERECSTHDSSLLTKSESVERVHLNRSPQESLNFTLQVRKVKNFDEKIRMKKNERLMSIIETGISKEFKSCSRIPKPKNSEFLCKVDRKYKVLHSKFQPRFGIKNSFDTRDPNCLL
ncbi:unnamed protein product [Moneuplotes crassus]|uniref:Uncharacterized protein n=1 Tax=Euplotes crassus TaxID=5936 RepID=A0AAD1UJS2_EUPCR|nr:unnamed protein product [Moneuplotes crassus]